MTAQRLGGYPVRGLDVSVGETQLRLQVVARMEDYVDRVALLRDGDAAEPPYWMHLWPGSRALVRRLGRSESLSGTRAVELGCGLGLPGIVAAMRGARVVMIDHAWDALCFARANAGLNRCEVAAVQADLRLPGVRGAFDLCLVADATYDPALQEAVAAFLASHLAPGGRAWCAESVRTIDSGFPAACARRGLAVSDGEELEEDDGRPVWVRVMEVTWAAGS